MPLSSPHPSLSRSWPPRQWRPGGPRTGADLAGSAGPWRRAPGAHKRVSVVGYPQSPKLPRRLRKTNDAHQPGLWPGPGTLLPWKAGQLAKAIHVRQAREIA
jgi:hypothetical protein